MMTLAEIAKEAQALPLESRGELVEALILSFDDSSSDIHDKQWLDEVKRRREEVLAGRVQTIDGADAARHVRDLLSK